MAHRSIPYKITPADHSFMEEAVRLSKKEYTELGGPFGAVIARDNKIISRGTNQVVLLNDPTAHAEIMAIREACRKLQTFDLGKYFLYSSCEPCPMCLGAIYWSNLRKIYYASTRKDAAKIGFSDAQIYREFTLRSLGQQTIPMIQIEDMRQEAQEVLNEWNKKAKKNTRYCL